ncbi:hypothetical protein RDI58_020189 [Solanum bulbocastanum]|uniref:Uncharacterized protein n=1 Tax=Solanum bulbocastanum TaxID=147425 RepID=A0AAN8TD51_SOLBU
MSMPQPPQNWPQNERDESHDTENLPDSEQQKQQIGSMLMPQPPQNWPQNERDESLNTKNIPDSNESEEQSKLTRVPTMMHSGWGKDGGNLHIELNEHGQVIGSKGARLSSKLGVLARNGILAPLNHKDWRLVPSIYKDRIWAHIKENIDATDDKKRILMTSFGSKWKESKHEAKTIGYDPYNTDIERLGHCLDRVEEDQWRSLVHYWSSKEAKMTKINNGVKPTRIEVFKKTHIRANKQPVNEIADEVMVPDNPLEDCQQPSSLVPSVHTRKLIGMLGGFPPEWKPDSGILFVLLLLSANMIKKTGTTIVGTNKKKWNF